MGTATASLPEYLETLMSGKRVPRPEGETWTEAIERTGVTGVVHEIDIYTYENLINVLPPKFMRGGLFAFAEGCVPWRLFWRHSGRFFSRQLDVGETQTFWRLAAAS